MPPVLNRFNETSRMLDRCQRTKTERTNRSDTSIEFSRHLTSWHVTVRRVPNDRECVERFPEDF